MNCTDEFCRRCALNTVCSHEEVCSDYVPVRVDNENEGIVRCVENKRNDYRSAFMSYIKLFED